MSAPEGPTGRRRDYVPSVVPGARLPHMNVRILSDTSSEVCCYCFLSNVYIIYVFLLLLPIVFFSSCGEIISVCVGGLVAP